MPGGIPARAWHPSCELPDAPFKELDLAVQEWVQWQQLSKEATMEVMEGAEVEVEEAKMEVMEGAKVEVEEAEQPASPVQNSSFQNLPARVRLLVQRANSCSLLLFDLRSRCCILCTGGAFA